MANSETSIGLDKVSDAGAFCSDMAKQLESEIEHMGVALGIDWNNEVQVRALAREALNHSRETLEAYSLHHDDYQAKAKATLFGLANIMMEIMAKSAGKGIHTHGGTAWKAFSKALVSERESS
jgi:hypothetical protein